MPKFNERLKKLREERGLSLSELSSQLILLAADPKGFSRSSVNMWERGDRKPGIDALETIADYFNVDMDYLLGKSDIRNRSLSFLLESLSESEKGYRVPVLGDVAAGIPIEAIEDILDWEEISPEMAKRGEFFGLKIRGDSMAPRILEGDVVIVRRQSAADSGDVVIAKVNGHDACCKKLIRNPEGITLQSYNPGYDPMYFSRRDIEDLPVTIVGKVVELRGKF